MGGFCLTGLVANATNGKNYSGVGANCQGPAAALPGRELAHAFPPLATGQG
jgi:hypothetical protein